MKFHSKSFLFAVLGLLALSNDGDACWRSRGRWRCSQSAYIVTVAPRDKRLETDKRNLPEFRESSPSGLAAGTAFKEPDEDTFTVQRHHRGRAKTTYADAPLEVFSDLRALILTLPDDDAMKARTQKNWDFDRINEDGYSERRNVRVTGYLFAIKQESDNDFHLIIDDDGYLEEGAKLNAEISGIPTEGPDRDAIRQVRDFFKNYFDGNPPTNYKPFVGPLRVVIEGSMFFDRDHDSGTVGPEGYRPASAWEIHPIRRIQFLDN